MAEEKMDLGEFMKSWDEVKAVPVSYNQRDLITYAVGIGATELKYVYENNEEFSMFPTYPVVLPFKGTAVDVVSFPSPAMMETNNTPPLPGIRAGLDGERFIEIVKPLPNEGGSFFMKKRLAGCFKKGKGAAVHEEAVITDAQGTVFIKMLSATFLVGAHGFHDIGTSLSEKVPVPKRAPDLVAEAKTSPHLAQLYRLSGDYNPLHVDPQMSAMMGFPQPILHGLCTMGVSAHTIINAAAEGDPSRFRALRVRWAKPVLPGETLLVEMWRDESNAHKIIFQVKSKERDVVVVKDAYMLLRPLQASL